MIPGFGTARWIGEVGAFGEPVTRRLSKVKTTKERREVVGQYIKEKPIETAVILTIGALKVAKALGITKKVTDATKKLVQSTSRKLFKGKTIGGITIIKPGKGPKLPPSSKVIKVTQKIDQTKLTSYIKKEMAKRGIDYTKLDKGKQNWIRGQVIAKARASPRQFLPKARRLALERTPKIIKQDYITMRNIPAASKIKVDIKKLKLAGAKPQVPITSKWYTDKSGIRVAKDTIRGRVKGPKTTKPTVLKSYDPLYIGKLTTKVKIKDLKLVRTKPKIKGGSKWYTDKSGIRVAEISKPRVKGPKTTKPTMFIRRDPFKKITTKSRIEDLKLVGPTKKIPIGKGEKWYTDPSTGIRIARIPKPKIKGPKTTKPEWLIRRDPFKK